MRAASSTSSHDACAGPTTVRALVPARETPPYTPVGPRSSARHATLLVGRPATEPVAALTDTPLIDNVSPFDCWAKDLSPYARLPGGSGKFGTPLARTHRLNETDSLWIWVETEPELALPEALVESEWLGVVEPHAAITMAAASTAGGAIRPAPIRMLGLYCPTGYAAVTTAIRDRAMLARAAAAVERRSNDSDAVAAKNRSRDRPPGTGQRNPLSAEGVAQRRRTGNYL